MIRILVLMSSVHGATPAWSVRHDHDGVRVETRDVKGSPFEEIRVTTRTNAAADSVCDAVWGNSDRPLDKGFKKRDVLRETTNERWTYEQIAAPLVSDRDYTMHVAREELGDGCRIRFDTQNEKGPAPQKGFVRIPVIRGSWDIRPSAHSGTDVVYTVYSEPGGSVPAFLSRGPSRSRAVEFLQVILARTRAYEASR